MFCSAPPQLEESKQQASEAEASLRATTEERLREAGRAAEEARARAERDLEEIRRASAGGTRELTERAKRREEVRSEKGVLSCQMCVCVCVVVSPPLSSHEIISWLAGGSGRQAPCLKKGAVSTLPEP